MDHVLACWIRDGWDNIFPERREVSGLNDVVEEFVYIIGY